MCTCVMGQWMGTPPQKKQICKIKKMWSFDMMNNSIGAHFVIDFSLVHVP